MFAQGPPMKRKRLRVAALGLMTFTFLVVVTNLSSAQNSPAPNDGPIVTQDAPPEKTVEQVFKNIKVLNGMPQSKLYPTMRFMAASLGFQCGSCHVFKNGFIDAPADNKPEKQTARQMIKMVVEINKTLFQGEPIVSCYTCHRGHHTPEGVPTLPLPTPSPRLSIGTPPTRSSTPESAI